jgi:chromate transporter
VTGGPPANNRSHVGEVFRVFLRLGVTAFGGPVAHLAFFHDEFVKRRRWLDEPAFADLVALCQFLPGPASSQFGFAVGLQRAGWPGALAAWAGFTLPAASAMILLALGAAMLGDLAASGWMHGLKLATVAVVAHAVWIMGSRLCRGWVRLLFALVTTILVLVWPAAGGQLVALGAAAVTGRWLLKSDPSDLARPATVGFLRRRALVPLLAFFGLLLVLPMLAAAIPEAGYSSLTDFIALGPWSSAADTWCCPFCRVPWWLPAWLRRTNSSPAMVWRRRCLVPCLLSRRISAPSAISRPTVGWVASGV